MEEGGRRWLGLKGQGIRAADGGGGEGERREEREFRVV